MKGREILQHLSEWPSAERDRRLAGDEELWRTTVRERHERGKGPCILFWHAQLPSETGSATYFQRITSGQRAEGLDVHVIAAGYEPLTGEHIAGLEDERITTIEFSENEPRPGTLPFPIPGMSVVMPYTTLPFRDLSEEQLHSYLERYFATISECVSRLQPDVVHVNHLWFLTGLVRLRAPWIPVVASVQGTARKLMLDCPKFAPWVIPTVRTADHVCAISEASKQECIDTFELPAERISIEGYGFDPQMFNYRPVDRAEVLGGLPISESLGDRRLILFVGKFVDWKGIEFLIDAVGRLVARGHDDIACLIIGEGTPASRAKLESQVREAGLKDHVFLPGKVSREQLPDLYRTADVFTMPSFNEPWGLVLMEALACGTPSVSARTGGPSHYSPQGEQPGSDAVLLIDPIELDDREVPLEHDRDGYTQRLADALERFLEHPVSPEGRTALSESMRHLSWSRLVRRLTEHYARVAKRG